MDYEKSQWKFFNETMKMRIQKSEVGRTQLKQC